MTPNQILFAIKLVVWLLSCSVAAGGSYYVTSQRYELQISAQRVADAKALAAVVAERDAELAKAQQTVTVEVVKYVDRVVQIPAAPVVADRLERMCERKMRPAPTIAIPAERPGVSDGAAAADSLDRLADELRTVQVNRARQQLCGETLKSIYAQQGR